MNKYKKIKGSFLLELMIGIFISSLTILVASYIYIDFEKQRTTNTMLSKTITTASLSLFPIQQNLKLAGYGFTKKLVESGCTKIYKYNNLNEMIDIINFSQKPIEIIPGEDNTKSDLISLSYSKQEFHFLTETKSTLLDNNYGLNPNWKISNIESLFIGDNVLIYDLSNIGNCVLVEVSSINIETKTIETKPTNGFSIPFNISTSHLFKFDLNSLPKKLTFFIENENLKKTDFIYENGETTTIGENIVLMKASIGLDTNGDGNVDLWKNSLSSTEYNSVIGIKIAILARSPIRENIELDGNNCFITTNNIFKWDNGNNNGEMDISKLNDWKCYRYRMLETTIPLKNLIFTKT